MNKIFSSHDPDPLERINRDSKRVTNKSFDAIEKNMRKALEKTATADDDLSTAGNRLLLRTEQTLGGLQAVSTLLGKAGSAGEKEAMLSAIIRQTRFQDEEVLAEFRPQLEKILANADSAALEKLVAAASDRLGFLVKDRIIRDNLQENIAALSSQDPKNLLHEVVRELKKGDLPQLSVSRQRVIDLLR
jgi:hypothetical protein